MKRFYILLLSQIATLPCALAHEIIGPKSPAAEQEPLRHGTGQSSVPSPGNEAANPNTGGALKSGKPSASSRPDVLSVQSALAEMGFSVPQDGVMGPTTKAAIRQFQQKSGLSVTGLLDVETREAINGTRPAALPKAKEEPSEL